MVWLLIYVNITPKIFFEVHSQKLQQPVDVAETCNRKWLWAVFILQMDVWKSVDFVVYHMVGDLFCCPMKNDDIILLIQSNQAEALIGWIVLFDQILACYANKGA